MKNILHSGQGGSADSRRPVGDFLRQHASITILSVCISGFFALVAILAKPLDPVKQAIKDFSFTDIYYGIQKETAQPDTSRVITIVDMTKLTSRAEIAKLLDDIEGHSPKVVGLDICFDNEGEDIEGNDALLRTVGKHKNIVHSMKMLEWRNDSIGWTKAIHSFYHDILDIAEGSTNMPRSLYDKIKRRVPVSERYEGKCYPSFVAQVACRYAGRDLVKGRTDDVKINFSPTVFRSLAPEEVSQHPELIANQIVLVGAKYEDADFHWTPIGKMSGVELMAYGTQSILYDNEIVDMPTSLLCIISLLVIFFVEVLQHKYLNYMASSKRIFVRYIVGSGYVLSILTFLFTSVLLGLSFIAFKMFNLSFNLAWALSVITFLGTSRSMYTALTNYFTAWRDSHAETPAPADAAQRTGVVAAWVYGVRKWVGRLFFTLCLTVLFGSFSTSAQHLVAYRVVGKVTQVGQGRQTPVVMNDRIGYETCIDIPYGAKLEVLDEANSRRVILKRPGRGTVKALSVHADNSIIQISAQYIAYVKKQMSHKMLVSQQRYTDFACVTREVDSVAGDSGVGQPGSLLSRNKFEQFKREKFQKYLNFRDKCNWEYTDFVRKSWNRYCQNLPVKRPKEPYVKPMKVPDAKGQEQLPPRDGQERGVLDEKDPMPREGSAQSSRPYPVDSIGEREESEEERQFCRFPFLFYGTPLEVRLDESRRIDLGHVTPDRVADALLHFASPAYDNLLYDCLKIREEHHLCDWAYLQMLRALTDQYSGAGSDEATVLLGFLCCQSGYKVRFATDDSHLYLLLACRHLIFDKPSYVVQGERYYPLEDVEGALNICEAAFAQEQPLSLLVTTQPLLSERETVSRTVCSMRFPEMSVQVGINPNLIDFYQGYPASFVDDDVTTRWAIYANTPVCDAIRMEVYPRLREKLSGLGQTDAVNRLLNFVQTGFDYQTDEEAWGGERSFFAEETLHYPYSDCEDRAILFTRLVRDLLGMECVLVYYPGHLAAAVHFDEQPGGTFYTSKDGTPYTLCDPTYIGAVVGMEMPQFADVKATLIHVAR